MDKLQGRAKGDKVEVKKVKSQQRPKKQQTQVKLPNARKSIRRQREMAQGKANYNDAWALVGLVVGVLLILFVLLGGVNQKAVFETISDWAHSIGNTVQEWVSPHVNNVIETENGIYIDLDGDGNPG